MTNTAEERSPGGSAILRHRATERDWTPAGPAVFADDVERHMTVHFGEVATVLHELASDRIHVDVHVIEPTADRDWWTLFTTGMSDLPMTVPLGAEALRFAELVIALPRWWEIGALQATPPSDSPELERWYWPIRGLKSMARLPNNYETWLGIGHNVPNGDPPTSFAADTKLAGWWLLPPLSVPEEGRRLRTSSGDIIHLYLLHALHADEMDLKLAKGSEALLDAFERAQVSEVLDPARASVIRKRRFGFFGR